MEFPKRIEITSEIEKVITLCPKLVGDESDDCFKHCPLAAVCMEYWTGDNTENQDKDWAK